MALRLAVVVSQAPGLGGTPSAGHRSAAVANASAAASSAMSRSPNRRVRAATTRAHSSWWAWVIASRTSIGARSRSGHSGVGVVGQELEHLLRTPAGGSDLGGPLQRFLA